MSPLQNTIFQLPHHGQQPLPFAYLYACLDRKSIFGIIILSLCSIIVHTLHLIAQMNPSLATTFSTQVYFVAHMSCNLYWTSYSNCFLFLFFVVATIIWSSFRLLEHQIVEGAKVLKPMMKQFVCWNTNLIFKGRSLSLKKYL